MIFHSEKTEPGYTWINFSIRPSGLYVGQKPQYKHGYQPPGYPRKHHHQHWLPLNANKQHLSIYPFNKYSIQNHGKPQTTSTDNVYGQCLRSAKGEKCCLAMQPWAGRVRSGKVITDCWRPNLPAQGHTLKVAGKHAQGRRHARGNYIFWKVFYRKLVQLHWNKFWSLYFLFFFPIFKARKQFCILKLKLKFRL